MVFNALKHLHYNELSPKERGGPKFYVEDTFYVYAEYRRGKKSHGAKFGKSSAYAVGKNVLFKLSAEARVDFNEIAAACVGRENHIIGKVNARLNNGGTQMGYKTKEWRNEMRVTVDFNYMMSKSLGDMFKRVENHYGT